MNQWMNDLNQNLNNQGFNGQSDPSMSFLQQPQTINPAQFQNQAYLNGATRTASPGFNATFQTNSVVPSKRLREEHIGQSPRQQSDGSGRSQTPGQPFPGFGNSTNGNLPFTTAPSPFQHLQTSNDATPSPTMQNLGFPQNAATQRLATASPNPFSPQHNMTSVSPHQPDVNNRMATPNDMNQNFLQNAQMNMNFNPQQINQAAAQMGMNQMAMGQNMMPQMPANMANYQMQLQAHARVAAQRAQAINGGQRGPAQPNGAAPYAQNRLPAQQEFIRGLQQFSAAKGRPLDIHPQICGRPIELVKLCTLVLKSGGSGNVTKLNRWQLVAQHLGFPPQYAHQAATEMQQFWFANIGAYESMWVANRQRLAAQSQAQQQQSPHRDGQLIQAQNHQRSQSDILQAKLHGQMSNGQQANMNGSPVMKPDPDNMLNHQKSSLSRQMNGSELVDEHSEDIQKLDNANIKSEVEPEAILPARKSIQDPFVPEVLSASKFHGSINVEEVYDLGQQILSQKPIAPTIRELGLIDIHALVMALKSGMRNETRNALDTLITISSEPSMQLHLGECDDLIDTLVDCAQIEVDFLSDHTPEVSDEISLPSYEELIRASHAESRTIQSIPEFGSLSYDLDRAADKLICITTLIRNFSFYEPNFEPLKQPEVVQILTRIIQCIGTKDLLLRSHRNTLDFMKDLIIYLSNLSSQLTLPDKNAALCLLHFFLSFAPQPLVNVHLVPDEKLQIPAYIPAVHKYLPPCIDGLAKMLACNDTNKNFFKSLFLSPKQTSSDTNYELLTRTFAMTISIIPAAAGQQLKQQIESRKPFLLQGLLAAEVLSTFAPTNEKDVARSWVGSEDCWVGGLIKVAAVASSSAAKHPPQTVRGRDGRPVSTGDDDPSGYNSIVSRALALLRILVLKARVVSVDPQQQIGTSTEGQDAPSKNMSKGDGIPEQAFMKKDMVMGALCQKDIDPTVLRLLCDYAGIADD